MSTSDYISYVEFLIPNNRKNDLSGSATIYTLYPGSLAITSATNRAHIWRLINSYKLSNNVQTFYYMFQYLLLTF